MHPAGRASRHATAAEADGNTESMRTFLAQGKQMIAVDASTERGERKPSEERTSRFRSRARETSGQTSSMLATHRAGPTNALMGGRTRRRSESAEESFTLGEELFHASILRCEPRPQLLESAKNATDRRSGLQATVPLSCPSLHLGERSNLSMEGQRTCCGCRARTKES